MSLRIGIDIGGTFTDLVAIAPDGGVRTHRRRQRPRLQRGIAVGLRALLTDAAVESILHATTVGSNTILEAKGRAPR